MAVSPEHATHRWLSMMGIRISPSLLREKMQSHPAYPSLLSVTDTLDELDIDNAALQVDKEKIFEMPLPFLAHYNARKEFVIINNAEKQIKPGSDFEKNWNSIALLAEKPENWFHAENDKRLREEKKSKQALTASALFIVLLAFLSLINGFSWQTAGLLIATLTGLIIATLIIQQELGIGNELTEKLCHSGSNTDCEAVMHSKGSRLSKWINWADAGIIYFTAYSLLLVTFLFTNSRHGIPLLALVSTLVVPVTLFSLYYQWKVVKKWCPLCLLIVAVLWVQFLLLLPETLSLGGISGWVSFNLYAFTAFIFLTISAGWLLLKQALNRNKELKTQYFSLIRFKNNPDIFNAFLKKQRQVDFFPFEGDIQLGNAAAPLQITVACNPYCGPCAKTHEILHELLDSMDAGLSLRFTIDTGKKGKHMQAVEYMLQLLAGKEAGYKRQVLHDWYLLMDLEQFSKKYPLREKNNVDRLLKKQEKWAKETGISFTPTIFINGNELPRQYAAADLKFLLKGFQWKESTKEKNYVLT